MQPRSVARPSLPPTKVTIPGRWFHDEKEGFVLAEPHPKDAGKFIIRTKTQMKDMVGESWPSNPNDQDGVPDNTQLMHLHEPGLLHNIRHRYSQGNIYTYTGYILIAINPYKNLPLYADDVLQSYRGKSIGYMPPHVFAIADRAYRLMKTDQKNQSILISGESGAGKTETSKIVMKFLVKVGGRSDLGGEIEDRILQSNPLMEAFGNAKTIRNNNSSRFGKFMEMQFNKELFISGSKIETYLLEQSRIVNQSPNERNYHIFYQLCAGTNAAEREKLHLEAAEHYYYLRQGNACKIEGIDDAEEFQHVRQAMRSLGLDSDEQFKVMRILAGILHLGNIEFNSEKNENASLANPQVVNYAAELLGLDKSKLSDVLCSRVMKTTKDKFQIFFKKHEAEDQRDVLAKSIYSHLFDWLVCRINKSLASDSEEYAHIGILDIFGFESFQKNSFEQLCINYTNETLQQYFNDCIFIQELDLYAREGIRAPDIEFQSNQDAIDLISKKSTGIFSILDEEMRIPKGNDSTFCDRVHAINGRSNKLAKPPKGMTNSEAFVVSHYAGNVCYSSAGFLTKNNDIKHPDHIALMKGSSLSLLCDIYDKEKVDPDQASQNFNSVSLAFSKSLDKLMNRLRDTDSHFIRCIKPNGMQRADMFEGSLVLGQLRCNGMMAALQLMHAGYPTRCPYDDLYQRFLPMLPAELSSLDPVHFCEALLIALDVQRSEFALGLTKLFFRSGKLAFLEDLRTKGQTELPKDIVRRVKVWLARKKLRRAIWSVVSFKKIEARLLALRALAFFVHMTRAVIRGVLPIVRRARSVRRTREAAELIQATFRGFRIYKQYKPILDRKRSERMQRMKEDAVKERERIRLLQESDRKRREEDAARKLRLQKEEEERVELEKRRQRELLEKSIREAVQKEFDITLAGIQAEHERKAVDLSRQLTELQSTIDSKSKDTLAIEQRLRDLQERNNNLTRERESATKKADEAKKALESTVSSQRQESATYKSELASLRSSYEKKIVEQKELNNKSLDEKDDEIAALKSELQRMKDLNDLLQKKVAKLEAELKDRDTLLNQQRVVSEEKIRQLQDENERLKKYQDEKVKELKGLQTLREEQITVKNSQLEKMERDLTAKTEDLKSLQALTAKQETKIKELNSSIVQASDEKKQEQTEWRSRLQQVEKNYALQLEASALETIEAQKSAEQYRNLYESTLQEMEESLRNATRSIRKISESPKPIQQGDNTKQNQVLMEKIKDLESQNTSLKAKAQDSENEIATLRKYLEHIEDSLRLTTQSHDALKSQILQLEQSKNVTIDSLMEDNFGARQDLEDLRTQLKKAQNDIDGLTKQLVQARSALSSVETERNRLGGRITELEANMNELRVKETESNKIIVALRAEVSKVIFSQS
eukprot:TRINITY_DN2126_c0_g1_i5.p1 TRINITY_DN2126_c0_g1~~TRINITY_DN2126_c0_g1_i5.p1  ORF type:complete len:1393 (+),score=341.23 TRINITY_DN2126_c0_g1_i5:43-4221(+)